MRLKVYEALSLKLLVYAALIFTEFENGPESTKMIQVFRRP
jgi:hypothetical protein